MKYIPLLILLAALGCGTDADSDNGRLIAEITVYTTEGWTIDNPEFRPAKGVTVLLYENMPISLVPGEPDFVTRTNENGIARIYEGNVIPECFIAEKDGKSNLIDNYVIYGIAASQVDIDNYPHMSGTEIGSYLFTDIDGNALINASDQVACQPIRITYGDVREVNAVIGR